MKVRITWIAWGEKFAPDGTPTWMSVATEVGEVDVPKADWNALYNAEATHLIIDDDKKFVAYESKSEVNYIHRDIADCPACGGALDWLPTLFAQNVRRWRECKDCREQFEAFS